MGFAAHVVYVTCTACCASYVMLGYMKGKGIKTPTHLFTEGRAREGVRQQVISLEHSYLF